MGLLLYTIYNIFSPLFFLLVAFFSFFSSRHSFSDNFKALKERIFPSHFQFIQKPIWFHASSIGEVKSLSLIVKKLQELKPEVPVLITVSTLSGKKEALKITPHSCVLPADLFFLIKKFIKKNNPQALFIVETELWPNLIKCASVNIPVKIINARMSDKSFPFYKAISPLVKYFLSNVSMILAQSQKDAKRYSFFIKSDRIKNTGNIKYDIIDENPQAKEKAKEVIYSFLPKNSFIVIFGSTHPQEEKIIAEACSILSNREKEMSFIIAPRHINKANITEMFLKEKKLNYARLSDLRQNHGSFRTLIVDENGILSGLYAFGDICFVGGTLDNTGGHNLLEPSIFSKPVIFGPNFSNAQEAGERLLETGGGFIVRDAQDISARIVVLAKDKSALKKAGENSFKAIHSLKGATAKTILEIIEGER